MVPADQKFDFEIKKKSNPKSGHEQKKNLGFGVL